MKQIMAIVTVLVFVNVGWGLESPIGSPTQVPSANQSGLIPSRANTYGNYANDIVTGNVGGGRHFRGVVPYNSFYYTDQGFQDSGSLEVSNFIRRSTGFESYYDPKRTVTTLTRRGGSGLEAPQISGQAAAVTNPSQAWLNSFDLTRAITPPRQSTPLVENIQRDLFDRPLREVDEEIADVPVVIDPMRRFFPEAVEEGEETPTDALEVPQPEAEPIRDLEASNLYEKIREELRKEQEARDETLVEEEPAEEEAEEAEETPEEERARLQAPQLRREYGTYRNLAQVRTSEYMDLGQKLLREGQFYKAADAFELANVWSPESATAKLARSHALFGAGEYMSSAYYLHEALTMDPDLARVRVKLDDLVGGRDLYETRIAELVNWQMRSQSGEMVFLTSYLMFMDNKVQRASDLAEQALEKMPESTAVKALQKAIENPQNVIEAQAPAAP